MPIVRHIGLQFAPELDRSPQTRPRTTVNSEKPLLVPTPACPPGTGSRNFHVALLTELAAIHSHALTASFKLPTHNVRRRLTPRVLLWSSLTLCKSVQNPNKWRNVNSGCANPTDYSLVPIHQTQNANDIKVYISVLRLKFVPQTQTNWGKGYFCYCFSGEESISQSPVLLLTHRPPTASSHRLADSCISHHSPGHGLSLGHRGPPHSPRHPTAATSVTLLCPPPAERSPPLPPCNYRSARPHRHSALVFPRHVLV